MEDTLDLGSSVLVTCRFKSCLRYFTNRVQVRNLAAVPAWNGVGVMSPCWFESNHPDYYGECSSIWQSTRLWRVLLRVQVPSLTLKCPFSSVDRACGYEPQGREFKSLKGRLYKIIYEGLNHMGCGTAWGGRLFCKQKIRGVQFPYTPPIYEKEEYSWNLK